MCLPLRRSLGLATARGAHKCIALSWSKLRVQRGPWGKKLQVGKQMKERERTKARSLGAHVSGLARTPGKCDADCQLAEVLKCCQTSKKLVGKHQRSTHRAHKRAIGAFPSRGRATLQKGAQAQRPSSCKIGSTSMPQTRELHAQADVCVRSEPCSQIAALP